MSSRLPMMAMLIACVALAVSVYLFATRSGPLNDAADAGSDARIELLEDQVARLERRLRSEHDGAPALVGIPRMDEPSGASTATRNVEHSTSSEASDRMAVQDTDTTAEGVPLASGKDIEKLIDRAVQKKAEELQFKQRNKKPTMSALASTLELNEEQIADTEREVTRGQGDIIASLDIPMEDGTNLLEEVVEIAASGLAKVKSRTDWGTWVKRVQAEKIPGTNETYGARIEEIKQSMRERFKQSWTKDQYDEYQAWGVDPFEINTIDGSPRDALHVRINARARALGAEIPDKK